MDPITSLPPVNRIALDAPFRWLAGAWQDLWSAPLPFLAQGLVIALICFGIVYGIYASNAAFWALVLTLGFVYIAPVLAMGPYEGGRLIELRQRPTLRRITFVRSAFRQDVAYLGLALLMIYFMWGRFAQIVYGLSTFKLFRTVPDFIAFATGTPDGLDMLMTGSVIGGAIAYLTFVLVVVSAPMLLDPESSIFTATASSIRSVVENPAPLTLWAVIIGILLLVSAATGFVLLVLVFPWLGLASWRAYRELVARPVPLAA